MPERRPDPDLLLVLEQSRDRGFLGPGPVAAHVEQAQAYVDVLGADFDGDAVDLGSGGGVPGLILARALTGSRWLLMDASLRRVRFLEAAVRSLGMVERVEVRHVRAEDLGREARWRGAADAVVARSFGPPAVVAECGAPLLRLGGRLAVSEPPCVEGVRWPRAGVRSVGLEHRDAGVRQGYHVAVLEQVERCPDRFPRRVGVPERVPLF
jgi:16S rRNA (guanine527-N7)-methyltransferase